MRRLQVVWQCARAGRQVGVPLAAATLCAVAPHCEPVGAQSPARAIRIGDEPRCTACRIQLVGEKIRDDDAAPQLASELSSLVALGGDRYLATQFAAQVGLPIMIGPELRIVPDRFRRGQGPGEYQVAAHVARARGDSVLILDPALGRVTVLSTAATVGRAIAGSPVARATDVVVLPSGDLVASLVSTARGAEGAPLQRFSGDWKVGRPLGAADESIRPSDRARLRRRLAPAHDGGFWAAQVASYEVERWSAGGALRERVVRDAPWFHSHDLARPSDPEPAPRPILLGVWEDDNRRLWSVSLVADRRWRTALGPVRRSARGSYATLERNDLYVDSVIEVLDVGAGCVLARARIDGAASAVSADGVLAVTTTSADGTSTVSLQRAELVHPPGKEAPRC